MRVTSHAGAAPAASAGTPFVPARGTLAERKPTSILSLLALTAVAVALAWWATSTLGLKASSRSGYWLGVAGGSAMLVVFLYPMRKRLGFMNAWGPAKPWFIVHMICGIAGPLVVLVHSGFHIGSINAGVAMVSMLVVTASGIAGRFIYVRIHHGLSGAHWTLNELRELIGSSDAQVHSRLAFAPEVERNLHAFHQELVREDLRPHRRVFAFVTAALRAQLIRARCRRELVIALKARAASAGWDRSRYRRALAKSTRLVDDYLEAVRRGAQLRAYERIFSLWHVLHLPLVWLLVVSAIAHVVAVHVY
jgi:hypothetical protein